jgi:hypothetical protein
LELLQQTDESADGTGTSTGETSGTAAATATAAAESTTAKSSRLANTSQTAGSLAGKASQTGATEETATPLWTGNARLTNCDCRVKALAIALKGSQVGEHGSFNNRQLFERHVPASLSQEWLNEIEIDDGVRLICVGSGNLPHKRIGKSD